MTVMAVSGRRGTIEDPRVIMQNNGPGGKYRVGGNGTEDSVEEIAKWSGEETEELATKEEAENAGEPGEFRLMLIATVGGLG